MITPIIKKEDLFNGYSDILLIGIYTDKISAIVVKKEKDALRIITSTTEPQEGGGSAAEKIRLNSEKSLQKLPSEILANVKNVVCILGGGVSELQLTVENKTRSEKDEKISEQEIAAFMLKSQADFINIEETFLVDGFAVENPVGMDGKEITARILSVSRSGDLEKIMTGIAMARGMRYLGSLDARLSLIKSKAPAAKDYCAIFIFEKCVTICIVRSGSISAISNIDGGYGIITEDVSSRMGVGSEEGKNIINNFNNNPGKEASEAIRAIVVKSTLEIKDKIYSGLANADKASLLPGTVFVVASDWNPELKKILGDAGWLSGLPIERNIAINIEMKMPEDIILEQESAEKQRCLFDYAALHYLNNF